MKLRQWICEGAEVKGKPMVLLTTPEAGREVAYRKMCAKIPEGYRFCVQLKRGNVVNV